MPPISHPPFRRPSACRRPSTPRPETAVSASISTPVWPVVLTVAGDPHAGQRRVRGHSHRHFRPPAADGRAARGPPLRFAPHDPGQPRDAQNPPVALPSRRPPPTSASVTGVMRTWPSANRQPAVAAFSETSTIWACPLASEMGELAAHRGPPGRGWPAVSRVAPATSACRMRLSPIRKLRAPPPGHVGEVGGREKAGFGDRDSRPSGTRGASVRVVSSVVSKVLRFAVVDPDQPAFQRQPRGQARRRHAPRSARPSPSGAQHPPVRRRGRPRRWPWNDQDAVGPPGPRLGHLVGIVEEILAQDGQGGGVARRAQVGGRALKGGRAVSTDRQGGAAGLVGARQCAAGRNRRGSAPSRGSPS